VEVTYGRKDGDGRVKVRTDIANNVRAKGDQREVVKYLFADAVFNASGPIATSIFQYGNTTTWEQCGDDVTWLGILDVKVGINVEEAVKVATQGIQGNWSIVTGMAEELLKSKNRRLTYKQCCQITDKLNPTEETKWISI
jgi:hypothetical protein